jgi:ElaB/YqjD/DUF883 family membrane-anchored ribosome-binding protein
MDEQNIEERPSVSGRDTEQEAGTESLGQSAKRMVTRSADMAQQATEIAKGAAASTASSILYSVKELLDRQVEGGAELVGHFANSVRCAADDLDSHAPQVAGLIRGISDRIESYSRDLHGQSVDQLMRAAADFTRRQPALVLGLAAVTGFFAVRLMSATPPSRVRDWSSSGDATADRTSGERDDL